MTVLLINVLCLLNSLKKKKLPSPPVTVSTGTRITIFDEYAISVNGKLVENTKRETSSCIDTPHKSTHLFYENVTWDGNIKKNMIIMTVMLTSGQASRPFGQIRSRNV
jgi:hypothetical protein